MKNAVTGNAAQVSLQCESLSFTEPFNITIQAKTGDAAVKVSRVYLRVVGCEELEVPDIDVVYDQDGDEYRRSETVGASNYTLDLEIEVTGAQVLDANSSHEWESQVQLPEDALAIYRGYYCQHTYKAFAGLDCFGNDPDSGWIELEE